LSYRVARAYSRRRAILTRRRLDCQEGVEHQ